MAMKVVHISTSDTGGAGLAAYRLHKALLSQGIESCMLLASKYFKEDERMKRECGCSYSGFHYSSIRYSMEGAHNLSFQDGNMVVLQDTILSKEKKDINITMWLEGQDNTDAHIHGTFVVKEV